MVKKMAKLYYGREYRKYEFCKSKNCWKFFRRECLSIGSTCQYTAKEFHKWLEKYNFKLVKEVSDSSTPIPVTNVLKKPALKSKIQIVQVQEKIHNIKRKINNGEE